MRSFTDVKKPHPKCIGAACCACLRAAKPRSLMSRDEGSVNQQARHRQAAVPLHCSETAMVGHSREWVRSFEGATAKLSMMSKWAGTSLTTSFQVSTSCRDVPPFPL